jgi:hypothetical protein
LGTAASQAGAITFRGPGARGPLRATWEPSGSPGGKTPNRDWGAFAVLWITRVTVPRFPLDREEGVLAAARKAISAGGGSEPRGHSVLMLQRCRKQCVL